MIVSDLKSLRGPYGGAVPRAIVDLVLMAGPALLAHAAHRPWATILAIGWIGAVPMHDLLVHGHDGVHRLLSRRRWLNEAATWATHALIGISGTAYRAFHLDHHRHLGTARDPEEQLLRRVSKRIPGWAYLGVPLLAYVCVNSYPFRVPAWRPARVRTARDLVGVLFLHLGLAGIVGPRAYALFIVAPIFTSLSAVVTLRSLCEHHGTDPRDPWTHTRTMNAGRVLDLLWSNTSYHLEHHLHPFVSCHRLPALRTLLAPEMARRGSPVDRGLLPTAWRLLRNPRHALTVEAP
jgi:fatty acid desaturase